MTLKNIALHHYQWLQSVGWAGKRTPLEDLALIASEIGEAANECRGEKPTDKLGTELADIILRVAGMAQENGIDIEAEVIAKMEINKGRGTRGRAK